MNRHNISYARNHLSELIARVREGETVWIVDRHQPVARLEPLSGFEAADADAKTSLARRGILRPARRRLDPKALAALPLPDPGKGTDIVSALLADREEGAMKFWDASAIVPLLVRQSSTKTLMRLAELDSDVVVWWGTSVECCSALMRLAREGRLKPADVRAAEKRLSSLRDTWSEILPGENCRQAAERVLRVHPLRAADALQLAAALIATDHEPRRMDMICLDDRLGDAARKEGFNVLPD